jgi:two-component system, chemotaxis family, protein-glutamate methylesterase/glutaminase
MASGKTALVASARVRPVIRQGQKIRVLVVDDSVVMRRLIKHALEQNPVLEVVGTAADGAIALQRIPQVNPDVVTLDVEMPVMDGLDTLRYIRQQYPNLCVIMFSTLTERGASTTLDALLLGANDYVTKPSNEGSLDRSMARLQQDLVPKIHQFFDFEDRVVAPSPAPVPAISTSASVRPASLRRPRSVVAIGVSTGGPTALGEIMKLFPRNFSLPILIVQHMPPLFTQLLAERLQTKCPLPIAEAKEGALVEPGKVLIAPGNYHMRLAKRGSNVHVTLDQSPPENSCRPAVDVMFRSVSDVYGAATIGIVLTGMGYDGLRGAEQLKANGAYIIAQDRESSTVWGMPGAVAEAGLADAIVSLNSVVPEILRQVG